MREQTSTSQRAMRTIETDIPARLDRLRWGRFHTLVIAALGITWVLDGLEVTLAGGLYLLAIALTATSVNFATSALFRMLTGAVALKYRSAAERRPLEQLARPFSSPEPH